MAILVSAVGVSLFESGSATGGAAAATTVRVSVSSSGAQANARSAVEAISPDGRFVLFDSWASNLVGRDTNGMRDVFLRDRKLGRTVRVSVGADGRQANGPSRGVAVSGDGRFVLFVSDATDLTGQPDRNHNTDVFVRDRARGQTIRVGVRSDGSQFVDTRFGGLTAAGISDNGRWVAFTHYVSHGQGCCEAVGAFVRDRRTHTTRRVGAGTDWVRSEDAMALSPDGRWIALGRGTNFGFVLEDLVTGRTRQVGEGLSHFGGFTPDADYVVYDDGNRVGGSDLIRWDRLTGTRQALISGTHYGEDAMGISDGGGNIAFTSEDPHLVPGDTNTPYTEDVFGYEVAAKAVTRLDLTSTGEQITAGISRALFYGVGGYARAAVFSGDSRWIVFASRGGRVVAGDTNHAADVFLRGPLPVLGGS